MKPRDLILRGYAKKDSDGSWYAICIDLNLIAQGGSSSQVHEKLLSMIEEYVIKAHEEKEHFSDLIPRKAPFYFFVNYYWIFIKNKIHLGLKNCLIFRDALPLIPLHLHGRKANA